jgi:hypothetical protein
VPGLEVGFPDSYQPVEDSIPSVLTNLFNHLRAPAIRSRDLGIWQRCPHSAFRHITEPGTFHGFSPSRHPDLLVSMEFQCRMIIQRRLHLLPLACGKHSAPSRTPFRQATRAVRLPTGIGVHLQTGMLFGITTECCSASHRNRVHLRPDSPHLTLVWSVRLGEVLRSLVGHG